MSIIKAKTAGTTVYFLNLETKEFLRVKGEQSVSDLWFDGEWNTYLNEPDIEVGKSMFFTLAVPFGGWQMSTAVSSIEEVRDEDLPKLKSATDEG